MKRTQEAVRQTLRHPAPRQAITTLRTELTTRYSDPRLPPGCLQTNTVLENATLSDAITRLNAAAQAEFQAALYEALYRARTLGQLQPGQDPLALAQFFAHPHLRAGGHQQTVC